MNFSPCHPFLITLIRSVQSQLTGLLVADIFQDGLKYKAALAYGGDGVQTAFKLSSRQFPCLFEPCCRSGPRIMSSATLLRALTHLSTNSASFPRRLKLQGVKMFEDDPVDQRRYGDIWKGISHDQIVCVKISGPYQRIPTQNLEPESQEALLWGQLSHLNILPFYGIHLNELMVRGGWSMKHSQLLETRSSTFLYSKIYRWAQGTEENKV